ncbi:hypothetical protein ACFYKX_09705 [Cytobacillus sp. FJAT-54145]|uniref:Chromosome segregation ATPase n=1 Tax=Cytobacillus spartinae TaxID=3299023 RepID=A0ABW6KDB7_9BACI
MPSISKIRFTNVVYEDGLKRYNDETFRFDGYNGAILLENGGGKTVFIQTALQAIIPHTSLADRKVKQTLQLDNYPAHVAIEWILSEKPRRYLVTAVSLFLTKEGLDSYRYVYPYEPGNKNGIEGIPFVRPDYNRPSDRGEISDYYQQMAQQHMNAHTFQTIKAFQQHIEDQYHIIANEWDSIVKINSTEGGVEAFFDECKQTNQLFDRLLIPTVEGAISGHSPNTFVDTFEKRRDSFKLYKELKGQIEENKAIEEQLNLYSLTYEELFGKQQTYEQVKQRAKSVLEEILRQEQRTKESYEEIQGKLAQWDLADREQQKKLMSLNYQVENSKLEEIEKVFKVQEEGLQTEKESLKLADKQFYSLKLAKSKQDYKSQQEKEILLKERLAAFDQQEVVEEAKERLDRNSQEIMGYFRVELEESQKRKKGLLVEIQPIEEQIEKETEKLEIEKEQEELIKQSYNQNAGKLEGLEKQMKRIKMRILSNPSQETVEEQLLLWEQRLVHLDEENVRITSHNKQLIEEEKKVQSQLENARSGLLQKEREKFQVQSIIEQAEVAHQVVKNHLAKLRARWATLDTVYLKQDSLTQQIQDQIRQFAIEKEFHLYKERMAYRLVDDYEKQATFFADPYVEQQVEKWKNQFHLIQTGVQYLQSLGEFVLPVALDYPLWPITLITTKSEVDQVKQKLQSVSEHLQYPVEVISLEQARAIMQGETIKTYPVVPEHWKSNQTKTHFHEWKQKAKARAEETTLSRKEIDSLIGQWEKSYEQLQQFLTKYPFEYVQEQRENLASLHTSIQTLKIQQRDWELKSQECLEQISKQKERIQANKEEYSGLSQKVSSGHEYIQLKKEHSEINLQQAELAKRIKEYNELLRKIKTQLSRWSEEKEQITERIRSEEAVYNKLVDDDLHREVKNFPPIYSNKGRIVLVEERQELQYELRKISSSRNEITLRLDQVVQEMTRLEKEMDELKRDYPELDEEMIYLPNGQELIDSLRNRRRELEKEIEKLNKLYENQRTLKVRQDQVVKQVLDQFKLAFPKEEPLTFSISLQEVEDQLVIEKKKLKEQKYYLINEQNRIGEEQANITKVFYKLEGSNEAHHFKGPSVQSGFLSEEEIRDFTYERLRFVEELTTQLRRSAEAVLKETEKVDRAKDRFKSFCKSKITDVKMREMARQGIDNKKTYTEVIEFQTNMKKRIQSAIKYSETTIINHDKDLEHFVTNINSHLLTIAGELAIIPEKTRVKIEDTWKKIYQFKIPEWTEEDGKSRIRKHIEWILEQLDSERFLTAEGTEDYGKIRKEIETWLQSKQLLRVVMNNESIKVNCRKVTNDNQVTTRSYSWEQSNVWSGGEKWSKNMTLFLGILNYVAEKQKHIESNMKRHRVVIMDNPFGKASSDHVLNPVFFIAEQLGFQIIALTAHAEGKFLRDYFPVIYSCRLRKAAVSNSQIMTKVKQLHQAFFQDHEPQALERLGEVEQLELF